MKWQWLLSLLAAALLPAFLGSKLPGPSLGQAAKLPTIPPTPTITLTSEVELPPVSPHLELSTQPGIVTPGELATLSIRYVGIGMPYTWITITPSDLVAFDPPVNMPCKYSIDPSHCTTFTLRALTAGTITISAGAEGEIFDETCHCWRFTWVNDNAPAVLVVADTVWKTFFPMVGVQ